MSKVGRILQLAQEAADAYELFHARRVGAGDDYTREVCGHLKALVTAELGPGLANQCLCPAHGQPVDFWIEEEQTIIELEQGLGSSAPALERQLLKALLAKDAGKPVRHLVLVGEPGAARAWQAPLPRAVMDWACRVHGIQVQIRELSETARPSRLPPAVSLGDGHDEV